MTDNNLYPNNQNNLGFNCWETPQSDVCESIVTSYLEAHGFRPTNVKNGHPMVPVFKVSLAAALRILKINI